MIPDEEAVVEEAAAAIRSWESWYGREDRSGAYRGATADFILSRYLEELGEPTDGARYFKLARAAAERAWGDYGRAFARPGQAKAREEERAAYYDRYRPSGRMLDLLDRDAA